MMPWFKVDDSFAMNPKTAPLSDGAVALWLRAGTWCCAQLTDGFFPQRMTKVFRAAEESIDELVEAGLWEECEDGWQFHDWHQYQPSSDKVEELRAKRSLAGKHGGVKSAEVRSEAKPKQKSSKTEAKVKQSSSKAQAKSNPVPVPVKKEDIPKGISKKEQAKKSLISSDWKPNSAHALIASEEGIDINREADKFIASAKANSKKYVDWDAAFRYWLRNAKNFNRPTKPTGYVNFAQQKLDDQMRRVQASKIATASSSQGALPVGGSNAYGY